MDDYENVFLPLPDIYEDGGTEFTKLAGDPKNLIIFPKEFADHLSHEKGPGRQALKFISQKSASEINEKYALFEVDPGLDLAYIKSPGFLNSGLEQKVKDMFKLPLEVITSRESEVLQYKSLGIPVSLPRDFILADANLVNKGILNANDELTELFYTNSPLPIDLASEALGKDIFPNQFVRFSGNFKNASYAICTGDPVWNEDRSELATLENLHLEPVPIPNNFSCRLGKHQINSLCGEITPDGVDQYFAVQYGILNPQVQLAFISGLHGSGKTLLTYAAALELILSYDLETQRKRGLNSKGGFFKNIALFRPNDAVGGDRRKVGWLPGTLWEKTAGTLGGFDSAHKKIASFSFRRMFELLNGDSESKDYNLKIGEGYLPTRFPSINIYSPEEIRGQSFEDTLLIVDEAQNYSQTELKALLTRVSRGSKAIVLGDPTQIDNNFLSPDRNGFISAIRHYLPFPNTFLMNLVKDRRSLLSKLARSWNS